MDPEAPYYHQNMSKHTRKTWNHIRNILSFHISTFWKSMILTFFDTTGRQAIDMYLFLILGFPLRNSSSPIVFNGIFQNTFGICFALKCTNISKSQGIKHIFKEYRQFVYNFGSSWILSIFAKSNLGICLIRVDSWYLCKIIFFES